jgi:transcription initiation factor TFIIIB Brf1 subunit/transcription initiation factor TFIIB
MCDEHEYIEDRGYFVCLKCGECDEKNLIKQTIRRRYLEGIK